MPSSPFEAASSGLGRISVAAFESRHSAMGSMGSGLSVGLVPHGGVRDLTPPGTDGVRSTAGPMATSLRDFSLFLKSILEAGTWMYDSTSVSVPWIDLRPRAKAPHRCCSE